MTQSEAPPPDAPPPLESSARQLAESVLDLLRDVAHTTGAFRTLLAADLALGRSALLRTLIWAALCVLLLFSTWLLLLALLVTALQHAGLGWLAAVSATALFALLCTALLGWLTLRTARHARLAATRRQWAALRGAAAPAPDGVPESSP